MPDTGPPNLWRRCATELKLGFHARPVLAAAVRTALHGKLTAEQRQAILWIKDVWHRRVEYPGSISGLDIYQAVLEHDVRTPAEFQWWLAREIAEEKP
jgi:hypothetical protein